MVSVERITIETSTPEGASAFYDQALGLHRSVRVRASDARSTGFAGWVLGLVVSQPADVEALLSSALDAGAAELKPASRSLWGYGGAVRSPDGTVVTVASSARKNTGPASRNIREIALQLGVEDVTASRRFYEEHGVPVAKSFGRRYAELATGPITVTLNKRDALAKTAGIPPDGHGSHGLLVEADAGSFTDPDGFAWGTA